MKENIKAIVIVIFFVLSMYMLSGCAALKGLADYRSGQKDKCECAPAWGCQQFK